MPLPVPNASSVDIKVHRVLGHSVLVYTIQNWYSKYLTCITIQININYIFHLYIIFLIYKPSYVLKMSYFLYSHMFIHTIFYLLIVTAKIYYLFIYHHCFLFIYTCITKKYRFIRIYLNNSYINLRIVYKDQFFSLICLPSSLVFIFSKFFINFFLHVHLSVNKAKYYACLYEVYASCAYIYTKRERRKQKIERKRKTGR